MEEWAGCSLEGDEVRVVEVWCWARVGPHTVPNARRCWGTRSALEVPAAWLSAGRRCAGAARQQWVGVCFLQLMEPMRTPWIPPECCDLVDECEFRRGQRWEVGRVIERGAGGRVRKRGAGRCKMNVWRCGAGEKG